MPQPPDLVELKERLQRLVAAIEGLPERQRTAIVARELEGRSHDEIARAMLATTPVVRQLIHRARTRLRDTLGFLVPIPWLRWLLVADPRVPAASERLGDAVAGGSAGAGLLKTGAVLLTTGAVATGGAGLVAHKHQGLGLDPDRSTDAQAQVVKPSRDTPNPRPTAQEGSGSGHRGRIHAAPITGERSGSSEAHAPRNAGEHGDSEHGGGQQDTHEKSAPDESDSASEGPHGASDELADSSGSDGGHGSGGGDSESTGPAEPEAPAGAGHGHGGPGPDPPAGP